jgi:hypothetical protein
VFTTKVVPKAIFSPPRITWYQWKTSLLLVALKRWRSILKKLGTEGYIQSTKIIGTDGHHLSSGLIIY